MSTNPEHPANDDQGEFMNTPDQASANTPDGPVDDSANAATGQPGNGGRVLPFRTTRPGTALVPDDSIDGELVDDAPGTALMTPREIARSREISVRLRGCAWTATRVTGRGVATGAKAGMKAVATHAYYAHQGAKIRRAERRSRRKHTELEQAIKTLRANAAKAEDFAYLKELEDTLERRRAGAAERRKLAREEFVKYGKLSLASVAAVHLAVLVYGLGDWVFGNGSVVATAEGIGQFWETVAYWSPAGAYWWGWLLAGVAVWAARTIPVGKQHADLPKWATNAEARDGEGRGVVPDESAILAALRKLGLGPLNQAFKEGWGSAVRPVWVQATGRDGKGWRTQLQLPAGVTVDMINRKKDVLAHNLVRLPVEVWPTEPKDKPGVLDLWVSDQGALSGPVDPWPLLHEGATDYFKGVPVGVDIRGTTVLGRLFEANYAAAGMMGSGKSTLVITLLLGALLDPLVEADVFVLASNADYDPMEPRLRTLRTGPGDEIVIECLETLRELYDDLSRRGDALKQHGERAVTRKIAVKDARLRPRIMVVDECQALFMHPKYGEEAADLVTKLISAARKYAVTLVFVTPEPSSASLPRKVISVISNKACFAIGDQQSNDAILGTGSYTAGISAVSLEPKTAEGPGDIGTAMARGFQAKPGLLRSFYVRKGDGVDEVTPVIERALKLRDDAGIGEQVEPVTEEERDMLADLVAVLGRESATAAQALAALKTKHPHYLPYQRLHDRMALVRALAELGVKVPSTNGRYPVDPDALRNRIAERDATEDDAAEAE